MEAEGRLFGGRRPTKWGLGAGAPEKIHIEKNKEDPTQDCLGPRAKVDVQRQRADTINK